jgi:CHAT domain-containing protein/predicted negative regulator of RcsB-dependent stress response
MTIRILQGLTLGLAFLAGTLAAATSCEQPGGGAHSSLSADQAAAIATWSATIARKDAPASAIVEARVRRADVYRALGRYPDAEADLTQALKATTPAMAVLRAVATQALGQIDAQQGRATLAEERLRDALAQARQLARPSLIAASANGLGNALLEQGRMSDAGVAYREALAQSGRADDPGLTATIQVNLARLASTPGQALRDLQAAHAAAARVTAPAERADLLLNVAQRARESAPDAPGLAFARDSLEEAEALAARAGLGRIRSQALGQLSELATALGRLAEARHLAEQAISVAPVDAFDLRYRWEWRLGQLLRAEGDRPRAIAAYRRAVDHLQRIRSDIPVEYAEGRSSFRETLEPLYLGLADLLLLDAATPGGDAARAQRLLREARDTVEQVKLDELRDYFRDACILPLREEVETLAARAAIFYPVIFADRVELLVSIDQRLYRTSTPIARERIRDVAMILALKLRYDKPPEEESALLYDWLIAPILPWLDEHGVDTLVFVPDGPLRAVPLGALAKNGHYLIERYAIATVPGLRLLQPDAMSKSGLTTLLAGLSRPGSVVDELPAWWVNALVQQNRGRGARQTSDPANRRGVSVPVPGTLADIKQARAEPLRAAQAEKIAALSLPGVAEEINQLSQRLPGRTLRDQEFLLSRFVSEIDEQPYRVVHIASHGLFQGPPEENFIVTYDRKLDMKTLADVLKPKELSQRPIELLVLSACQTAEGDDRTPLGLSGVALQSGARSALGSLWPVSDAATQLLMRHFYEYLKTPGITKGRALQAAQKALIADEKYRRPSDWAAFILVGNWL